MCYEMCLLSKGVSKKKILSQYEFRKEIDLACIDIQTYWKSKKIKCTNDEANENSTRKIRSNKRPREKKERHITDDSFKQNGKISHRMSKSEEEEVEYGSVNAKCCIHRWATD